MARARAADYEEKRDAILARAARVFAEQGYERASMNRVAEACGVSKALLYHYHPSKESLLFDIIHGHLRKLVAVMEQAPDDPDPKARLLNLVAALLDAYRDADAEHKLQLEALGALPPERQEEIRALERRLVAIMAEAVRKLHPALPPEQLKPAVMSLFGMLNWFYLWFREGGPMSRRDYARMAATIFADGVRSLGAAPASRAR